MASPRLAEKSRSRFHLGPATVIVLCAIALTSLGLSILMVTHDLDSLYAVCDRIAVLLDKRVVVGTMGELLTYDHPWVREYFHGPRGRAAAPRQEQSGV